MYTQCPECEVAFRVTADVLKQAAGKVRCGSCGHTWRQLPTSENDAQPPPQGPSPGPVEIAIDPFEADPESESRRLRRRSAAAEATAYLAPLTQEHIGDMLGLSTEYVNRLLGEIRAGGEICLQNRRLIVPDFERAAAAFGYDPSYLAGQRTGGG